MSGLPTPLHKGRFYILVIGLIIGWLILEANLFRFQIIDHERLSEYARKQYESEISLKAQRGNIFDRAGNKLATNILYYDIAADPLVVKNKSYIAKTLAKSFKKSERSYLSKMNRKSRFAYLERRATQNNVKNLLKFEDPGLIPLESFGRYYPYNQYAAQLLGFTDPDDKGLSGLELQFEEYLSGKDGKAILQYDATRGVAFNADYPRLEPVPGADIHLTLDKDIQTVAEKALKSGVDKVNAKSGMAVIMDPYTGAVLAMVNYPGFNPNKHKLYKEWQKKNRVITDAFEPGSTMKMFTAATILQERLHKPNDIVFCENGRFKIYNHHIRDTKPHAWLTFRKVIEKSSNIGMIKLTDNLKSNTFFRYLKNFGFGSYTEVGLIGESEGSLSLPANWSGLSKASISIGQEIGVTALQITNAFSALLNGGYLYRPFIIREVYDPDNPEINFVNEPLKIRQIISPEVCMILKDFMKGVVEEGTGLQANVPGISVGGKTGTAQKFDRKKRHYKVNKYVASFIGFAPFDKPKYVCAIFVDEPVKKHYGGDVAAPIFSEIISQIAHFEKKPIDDARKYNSDELIYAEKNKSVPQLEGFRTISAVEFLEDKDLNVEVSGEGDIITSVIQKGETILLQTGQLEKAKFNKMPDLKGLTLRQAINQIDFEKIRLKIQGSGKVYKQTIPAGSVIKSRHQLVLSLR